MKLLVGLGNPGEEYRLTRHNIGFLILDEFAKRNGIQFGNGVDYEFGRYRELYIVKPLLYMNRSGIVTAKIANKHDFDDILVVFDDANLPLGDIRLRTRGSAGGHNGVDNMIQMHGTDEFNRIRIGIGSPDKQAMRKFVLDKFQEDESQQLQSTIDICCELLQCYARNPFQRVLDTYSKIQRSYSEEQLQDRQTKGGNE